MITTIVIAAVIIAAAVVGLLVFVLRRDEKHRDFDSVGQRVERAMYYKSFPNPCADGHEALTHEFAQRRAPSGATVLVYDGSFCTVCTEPAPTPPWRDCLDCQSHITAGGLGLEFELEPCRRHEKNAGWDGRRWKA